MASTEDEIKSTKDEGAAKKVPKEDRMKVLEKHVGIIKLDKPLTFKEILEMEKDN